MFIKKVVLTILGNVIKLTEKMPGSFYQKNYPRYLKMQGIDISTDIRGAGIYFTAGLF